MSMIALTMTITSTSPTRVLDNKGLVTRRAVIDYPSRDVSVGPPGLTLRQFCA